MRAKRPQTTPRPDQGHRSSTIGLLARSGFVLASNFQSETPALALLNDEGDPARSVRIRMLSFIPTNLFR